MKVSPAQERKGREDQGLAPWGVGLGVRDRNFLLRGREAVLGVETEETGDPRPCAVFGVLARREEAEQEGTRAEEQCAWRASSVRAGALCPFTHVPARSAKLSVHQKSTCKGDLGSPGQQLRDGRSASKGQTV